MRDMVDPDLARQRLRLWLHMLKTVRHMEAELRERLRCDFATTLPRFDAMAMLDREPQGLTLSQLSQRLMVSNGNVTGIIARLVADGMVEREALAGDRRAIVVRLTPMGLEAMAQMAAAHLGWIDGLMAATDEADIARTMAVMIEIRRKDRT